VAYNNNVQLITDHKKVKVEMCCCHRRKVASLQKGSLCHIKQHSQHSALCINEVDAVCFCP